MWPGVLTVGILLVVALALSVSGDGTPSLFAEDLRDQAGRMSRRADTFRELLPRMASVERTELTHVVDQVTGTAAEVDAFLADAEPPPELAGPSAVLRLAVSTWMDGVSSFEDALLTAADEPAATGVEERLLAALLELRTGDRLYARFLEGMEQEGVPQPVSPIPEARFLPDRLPLPSAASSFVGIASSGSSRLRLRASLAIQQVATQPRWVVDTEGAVVVPETSTLEVRAVVANQGNIPSSPSTLVLRVEGTDGTATDLTQPVEVLEAQAETTVAFPGFEVTPGESYLLEVRLARLEGEEQTDDNTRTVQIRINPETPETTTTTTEG